MAAGRRKRRFREEKDRKDVEGELGKGFRLRQWEVV